MAGLHFDITGDNSNFIRKLQEVENGVRQTSRQIEQSGLGIEELFGRMTRAAVAFGAGFTAKELISNIVQVRGEFQQLEVAFKTMLGSEEKANTLMQQLVKTAAITPFDLQGVANGAKQLLAYGLASDKVNETLIRLGDIAAGLSIPLNDLVYLYGTTMTQGRLFTQDLRQFQGRGIPLADELAKQFGVTKDKVGELVTAGKVGFPEVQKAIEAMTSEGGKFGGLMEAQSKTITGQISNIEDAISTMFNEIGKANEGIINDALSGVSYLVENYEKIGKVIAELVITYGAYKAAVIAVAAAHKASTIWGNVSAFLSLTKSVRSAKDAMLLFNMAVKANPLGLVISAIAATVSAFILFRTKTDEAAMAQAEMKKNIEDEIKKLDEVYNSVNKAKDGTEERKKAIDKFNSDYGQYLSKLLSEKSAVEDISNAYVEAKKSLVEFQIAKSKDNFLKGPIEDLANATKDFYSELGDWTKELETPEQQARFTAYVDQILDDVKNGGYFNIDKIYDAFRAAQAKNNYANVDAWKEAFRAGNEAYGESDLDIIDRVGGLDVNSVDNLGKSIQRLQGVLTNAESDFEKFSSTYTDIVSPKTSGGETVKIDSFAEQVKAAKENVAKLNKELDDLKNGKVPDGASDGFDFAKAIEDKTKELSEAQKKLNTLTGYAPKAAGKRLKAQEKLDEELLSLERQNQQDEISILADGTEKKLAQIKLDFDKQEDAIRKRVKELAEANKEAGITDVNADGLTTDQQKAIDDANRLNADARKKAESEVYKSLTDAYQSYTDQRLAIERKYNEDIIALQEARRKAEERGDAEQVAQINRSIAKATADKGKALMSHDFEVLKQSPEYIRAFEDLKNTSSETLESLLSQLENAKQAAAETLNPEDLREYTTTIQEIMDELDARNPFQALADRKKELADAEKELADAKWRLDAVRNGAKIVTGLSMGEDGKIRTSYLSAADALKQYNEAKDKHEKANSKFIKAEKTAREKVDELADAIKGIGDAIGGQAGEIISFIGDVALFATSTIDGIDKVARTGANAISAVEKASVILGIISTAIQLFQKISELGNNKAFKQYEAYAEKIKEINALTDAVNEYRIAALEARQAEESWFSEDNLKSLRDYKKLHDEVYEAYVEKATESQAIYKNKSGGGWLTGAFNWLMGNLSALSWWDKWKNIWGQGDYDKGQTAAINNLRIETRKRSKGFLGTGIGGHSQKTEDLVTWARNQGLGELFDDKGLINKELAQSLIDNYGNKLVGQTKETLEALIELREKYDEYMEQLHEYVSSLYEPLVDNFVDSLWDWLDNGKDALDSFKDYASDTFRDIVSDMMRTIVLDKVVDGFDEQISDLYEKYASGEIDEQELMKRVAEETGELMNRYEQNLPTLENILSTVYGHFDNAGIDLKQSESSERTATAKGLAQASQDSVDELNGRFTTIMGHTYSISENMVKLAELQQTHLPFLQNLSYLAPIEENTYYCRRLDGMDADLRALRNAIEDIQLRGITVRP